MAIEQLDLDLLVPVEVDGHKAMVGWDDIIAWYWRCIPCGYRGAGYESREEAEKWMRRHTSPEPIPVATGPDPLAPDPKARAPLHGHERGYRFVTHKHENWWRPHAHSLRPFEEWIYVHPDDIPSEQPDACIYGYGRTKHIEDDRYHPDQFDRRRRALCGFKGGHRRRNKSQHIPVCRRCQQLLRRIEEVGHV